MRRRVLFVCYYAPPQTSVGVHRTLRFLKDLPSLGIDVELLTLGNPDPQFCPASADPRSVPRLHGAPLHHVDEWPVKPLWQWPTRLLGKLSQWLGKPIPAQRIVSWFTYIDLHWGWIVPARRKGAALLASGRFDAVYVSVPPFSSLVAARAMAKQAGLPLILDFRDSWVPSPYGAGVHRRYDRLERSILSDAAALIANTEADRALYAGRIKREKISVIPNGYDAPFEGPFAPRVFDGCLRLGYLGSWDAPARDPAGLLRALARVPFDWKIITYGTANAQLLERAAEFGVLDHIEARGFVAKTEMAGVIADLDALLTVQQNPNRGQPNSQILAKTYDYLATGRPVLALVGEGANRDFFGRYGTHHFIADPDEDRQIEAVLGALYAHVADGPQSGPDAEFLTHYSARAHAQALAECIQSVLQ